ncbi:MULTISPECIES: Fe-S cluster assembly protein SufD [Thermomonospora]|uniref:FeS assembly protein SufD n=1 Tax=Thermomonospora curvata (strain ATCC 19995 / DSM 43183 / JCM 3096 / KCTC 9072 / NBRC 15933 / NCIMB 10081 / Henssen B9) TaxID=471852 RepID=D1A1V3_THECD|nr:MULTISPECIES: Fe-S cluster assembly protein SufD [Thermomonospora]ACY97791.1 FeS assembly protein SufD [Thermomonospora curvata DSM 43183]PKK14086.1 MAG: Fe-S cluster assembly protein SufD [Thermomonospora sp. CIF 1]
MGLETKPLSTLHGKSSYDVADFPVPTGREEEWRFTPLRRLRDLHKGAEGGGEVDVVIEAAPEVKVERVGRDDPRLGGAYAPTDRVSAQAYSSFTEATVLTVPKEAVASQPTVLRITGRDAAQAAYGHTTVVVEPFAQATVVLAHTGSATYADNVEFVVGDGAKLSVISVQDWADDAVHLSHQHARLGRDASFTGFAVSLGGDLLRIAPSVAYTAPGGDAELYGVYFVDAGQHIEHRLLVDHAVPHCRSRVDYRGALQGQDAHAVWIGDVIIRAEGEGTDTYELNRNLVLTDGTRVDSVPNLEILTGEVVGAGHASASGRLDDEHLFYLQARGISKEDARRMVVLGFLGQLVERIEVPEIREKVQAAIEAELER